MKTMILAISVFLIFGSRSVIADDTQNPNYAQAQSYAVRSLSMSESEGKILGHLAASYPPEIYNFLVEIVRARLPGTVLSNAATDPKGTDPGREKVLLAITGEIEKAIPKGPTNPDQTAKATAEQTRAQFYNWGYSQAVAYMPMPQAAVAAHLVERYAAVSANAQNISTLLNNRVLIEGKGLNDLERYSAEISAAYPPGLEVTALTTKIAEATSQSSSTKATYDQVLSNLPNAKSALLATQFITRYPTDLQSIVQGIFTYRGESFGSDLAQTNATIQLLTKIAPPGGPKSADAIKDQYARASAYSTIYAWARTSALLPPAQSAQVANLLQDYPQTDVTSFENAIAYRLTAAGVDFGQLKKYLGDLHTAMPPEMDPSIRSTLVAAEADKAKIFYDNVNWARAHLTVSDPLALTIGHFMEGVPADQQAPMIQAIKVAADKEALDEGKLRQIFYDVSMVSTWTVDSATNQVSGCLQKNLVDPSYRKVLDVEACKGSLPTNYDWINEATKECGLFTDRDVLIEHVADIEQCSDPIARDLKPCLSTMDRAYRFYHYTTIDKIKSTLPAGMALGKAVEDHANIWANHALEDHAQGNNGLYTATDPYTTYGGYGRGGSDGKFYLYRVEMPAGSTFLDIPVRGGVVSCQFSPASVKKLKAANCPSTDVAALVENENITPPASCNMLLKRAYKKLKLRGWSYNYGMSTIRGCKNRTSKAFVWFDVASLPRDNVRAFSTNLPPEHTPDRQEAAEIEKVFENVGGAQLWRELAVEAKNTKPVEQLEGEYLMGCENLAPPPPPPKGADPAVCDPPDTGMGEVTKTINGVQKVLRHKGANGP